MEDLFFQRPDFLYENYLNTLILNLTSVHIKFDIHGKKWISNYVTSILYIQF